jgi:hypothetical protein
MLDQGQERKTNLHKPPLQYSHTGNAGRVILLKHGSRGGSGQRVAMASKAASASGCAEVGSLWREVGEGGCS